MRKSIVQFDRAFQIWSYTVSHGQLLLRSPKSPAKPTRIDVLFSDTRVLELRARFSPLAIEEVEPDEVIQRPTGPREVMEFGHRIFLLKCEGWTGCVVAGAVHWHEDEGEYGQPSALIQS